MINVNIKTLTPIWTGGVEAGKVDRIHETGILGSLRWWMENLSRGAGGSVCDPTQQECLYDTKKQNNGLCEVCSIFGATGWKRRFRLEIQDSTISDHNFPWKIQAQRSYNKGGKKQPPPTWYFPKEKIYKPKVGKLTIQIQSLHPDFKPEIIGGLIQFIADWSALGARPQMGFGVIQVEGDRLNTQPLYDWLTKGIGSDPDKLTLLPSLQNTFWAQIRYKNSGSVCIQEETFNLKYDLRHLFASDRDLRHFIMGTVKNERIAAKIKISHPYGDNSDFMRIWGWIPKTDDLNQEEVVQSIFNHLQNKYNLVVWREINSQRDTQTPNIVDSREFLQSLLQLKENSDAE